MTRFHGQDLTGARFERVSLRDAQMKGVDLTGVRMRGVELVDVEISGELQNVVVNGVDIAPLVEAELNLRMPARAKMRPDDIDGFREAWGNPRAALEGHRGAGNDVARGGASPQRRRRVVFRPDPEAPQLRQRCLGRPNGARHRLAMAPVGSAVGRGTRLGRHPVGPGGATITR
jgi:hypothetical protein